MRIVLDTDMTKHFNVTGMCTEAKKNIDELKDGELLEIEKRRALMSFVVHCCDISNPIQPFDDFRDWGLRIVQEFNDCYDAELHLQKLRGDENSC